MYETLKDVVHPLYMDSKSYAIRKTEVLLRGKKACLRLPNVI